jgi:D-sedoheptulose 7-phosphate isomerase
MIGGTRLGNLRRKEDQLMLGVTLTGDQYLRRLASELQRIDQAALQRWADLLYRAWEDERFVFFFGNGGSGLTASHMSEDLGKSTLKPQELRDESNRRLKVLSLTDNAGWIMAVANDVSYDQIFVQQLMNYGRPGDVAIGISGSGNSPNVLHAVDWANRHGLATFGLTGYDGGRLKQIQQDGLHVDLDDMGMVESIHLGLSHWVLNDLHARIHREGRHLGK